MNQNLLSNPVVWLLPALLSVAMLPTLIRQSQTYPWAACVPELSELERLPPQDQEALREKCNVVRNRLYAAGARRRWLARVTIVLLLSSAILGFWRTGRLCLNRGETNHKVDASSDSRADASA